MIDQCLTNKAGGAGGKKKKNKHKTLVPPSSSAHSVFYENWASAETSLQTIVLLEAEDAS